jgi:hypothetical protein
MNTIELDTIFGSIQTVSAVPTHTPTRLWDQMKLLVDPTVYDTGFKAPTRNGTPSTYDGSATEYTNPGNAYADDGSYATATDNEATYKWQSYDNFAFGIPAGAKIEGIEVQTNGKASAVSVLSGVYIYSQSFGGPSGYADQYFTTTEATLTHGGATDLWYQTWNSADFADGTFYLLHFTGGSNNGRVTSLDMVKVKVYYTVNKLYIYDTISNAWKYATLT